MNPKATRKPRGRLVALLLAALIMISSVTPAFAWGNQQYSIFSDRSVTIDVGERKLLSILYLLGDWSSSDESIVTVKRGMITGIEEGEAVVTADAFLLGTTRWNVTVTSDHVWDDGVVTVPATCTQEGSITYTCTECGATKVKSIPIDPEQHGEILTEVVEAGCTTSGYEHLYCEDCGVIISDTQFPETGHDWDAGVVTEESTCTDDGTRTYTCTRCGDTYTRTIPATGHNFVNGDCTVCGEHQYILGNPTTEIVSGKKYAIIYPSKTPYALSHEDSNPSALHEYDPMAGKLIPSDMVWTITTNSTGNYLISAEVDGKTQYLARTKQHTNGGYKITMLDSKYAWKIQGQDEDRVKVSDLVGESYYALRPHTLNTGWIVCAKVANIQLYEVIG